MNHLKLIFGCTGKKCIGVGCLVHRLIDAYPTPSERLSWWNSLPERDKEHVQKETFHCDRNDK